MKIESKKKLADFCSFRTGGEADFFVVVKNLEDLKEVVNFAKQNSLPVFVLGGGSNLLVSDDGVRGLVIKMEFKCGLNADLCGLNADEHISDDDLCESNNVRVVIGAGEVWDEFVEKTIEQGLTGLENLSFIPGTVGASVVQNIGAYGAEVKDFVEWVEVYDMTTGEIKKLTGTSCKFGYRDSFFKKPEGRDLVVLRVAFSLQKFEEGVTKLNMNYKDIQDYFARENDGEKLRPLATARHERASFSPSPQSLRQAIIQIRKNKLPDWTKIGTAGSFFKNPVITKNHLEKLLEKYPDLPHFPHQQTPRTSDVKMWVPSTHKPNNHKGLIGDEDTTLFFKIPLAYVLDKILGMKGYREGDVGLYENQPLALVNHGGASTQDIKNLAQKIQKEVKEKLDIDIDREVVEW